MSSFFTSHLTPPDIGVPSFKLQDLTLPDDALSLVVLGPGNGESLLVKIPPDRFMLVDSFMRPRTSSGVVPILDALDYLGGDLSCAVLTHPHSDHVQGFDRLVAKCLGPIGVVEKFLPGSGTKWDAVAQKNNGLTAYALNAIHDRWQADPTSRWELVAGTTQSLGDALVTVLHPDQAALAKETEPNELSSPLLVEWESVRLILGADLPTGLWPAIASSYDSARHQGLKLPHHASKLGFCPQSHGPGDRQRTWVATPYKRGIHPPRFDDGEGVDMILQCVDSVHLTSVLFPTPSDLPDPASRSHLLQLANRNLKTVNLPGASPGSPVVNPKDPDEAWVAASWGRDGTLLSVQRGGAAVRVGV